MKYYFLFILIFVSFNSFADTVRIVNPTALSMTGVTSTTFSLNVTNPSGDATDEASPAKVYVPTTNAIVDHDKYFSKFKASTLNLLFDTGLATHLVNFPLTVVVSGTRYLYAAAKSPTQSGYKVIQKYSSAISSNEDVSFAVSPNAICAPYASDCTLLNSGSSNSSTVVFKVYFFVSTISNLAIGDTLDPSTNTGGVYFDVGMSNRIYIASDLEVLIVDSKKGDGRVILTINSTNSMANFKNVLVFKHSSPPATPNLPIGAYTTGALIDRDFSSSQTGEVTIDQLVNKEEVILSVAFQDNYGFATVLSDDVVITPLDIQELLKKQACFLLTAGFGEEHYVINFFRQYRDQVLAHTFLGKKFIEVYYREAPHYALVIYKHSTIRWGVRVMAYLLYFLFNYYWIILILGLLSYLNFILRTKKNTII